MALFVLKGQLRKISPPSKEEVLLTVTQHWADSLCFLGTASDTGLASGFYSMCGEAHSMSSGAYSMSSGACSMSGRPYSMSSGAYRLSSGASTMSVGPTVIY